MSESIRAYIATKAVRHVATYHDGEWHSLCTKGPDWDWRGDTSRHVWDADPRYDDPAWRLPVCKRCVTEARALFAAALSPWPPVPVGSPGKEGK